MKAATITEIRKELKLRSHEQLVDFCLKMARFKLESKELLTYLVFESENEEAYVTSVKSYITREMNAITARNYYYIKKSIRKILRQTKRYIRYSKNKETEAEILLHFCAEMLSIDPPVHRNRVLKNMYHKQLEMADKAITRLHEDLQYDLQLKRDELEEYHE